MAQQADSRPPYEQVAADLRARIMAGDLPAGGQLPSTAQLVEEFGVSNTTVQKALAVLKGEGFLSSRQGKGVYVRDRQPFRMQVGAYVPPSPGGFSYDLLHVGEVPAPSEVATALRVSAREHVLLRKRLLRHADHPVEAEWSYYPLDLASGTDLTKRSRVQGGAPRVLAELGHTPKSFVDAVSARMPTTDEMELLELPDVPVIRQFRVIYSSADRPVEASVLVKGAHLYELLYQQST